METVKTPTRRLRSKLIGALATALMGIWSPSLVANELPAEITIAGSSYGAVRNVEVELNKSMIVNLPAGVAEVIVSQPTVAAAIMRSRTRAIVQGVTGGDTNIFFLDDSGRTIQVLDLRVIEEPSQVGNALEAALARVIPGSRINVESVTLGGAINRVVLTGTVPSAEDRERAESIAIQFAGAAENVANIIDVSGPQQVTLQVTVSEIRRDVARQLGINLSGSATIGGSTIGFNNPSNIAGVTNISNGLNAQFPLGDFSINAQIRALEARNAARVLAQPSLTAMSGQPADFLVGGQIRYQSGFDPGTQQPLFALLDYGIKLNFTPTVKSNGAIGLVVSTEVSEPIANNTISTRQASTTVELPPGSTLAIGGLLEERNSRVVNQIPGLGNIPILGALFRSNEYRSNQTELVILVTPYLVQPTTPANAIPVPTDKAYIANDAEAFFLGAIEKRYGVGATGEFRGGFAGSVGFVLD